MLGIRANIS